MKSMVLCDVILTLARIRMFIVSSFNWLFRSRSGEAVNATWKTIL